MGRLRREQARRARNKLQRAGPGLRVPASSQFLRVPNNSFMRFEIDPNWVPRLDANTTLDCMPASAKELTRFERREIYAARVRIASDVGSQIHFQHFPLPVRQLH